MGEQPPFLVDVKGYDDIVAGVKGCRSFSDVPSKLDQKEVILLLEGNSPQHSEERNGVVYHI